jgi:outer membrane protein TolC
MKPRIFLIFLVLFPSACSLAQVRNLDYFLQQGLVNSPLLKDLNNQVRMNSVDSLLVNAARQPQVKFNGLMMYAPVIHDYGYSEAITNGGNLVSTVNVSQNIFNKKTIEAQYSKIGIQNQTVKNTLRLSEKELKKIITDQYLTTYTLSTEIDFKKTLLKSANNEESILKQMVEKGVYRETDYLSFLLELQLIELDLNDLRIQYQKELSALKLLCGIRDTLSCELLLPDISISTVKPKNSPFFERFRIDSLQIINEKILIDRNYKPAVSWMTDAGLVNNDPAVIYKNLGLSAGMSLTLPVYDGNQRKLNYSKLKLSEDTRKGYEDFFKQQYSQQVQQLNKELRQTLDVIPKLEQQLKIAESIIRLDRDLLNNGGITITDFVIAVKNLVTFTQNLNEYQVKVLRISNEINYWQE